MSSYQPQEPSVKSHSEAKHVETRERVQEFSLESSCDSNEPCKEHVLSNCELKVNNKILMPGFTPEEDFSRAKSITNHNNLQLKTWSLD